MSTPPSVHDVEVAIAKLELPWHEALSVRAYYAWARAWANGTVRLVWWVLVGSVALAFMAYVLLVLAFAIKEVL